MINLIKMSTDKMSMWEAQWAKGDTSFHLPEVNDRLLSYMNELVGVVTNGTTDPAAKNILVPLCGKSKDLVHLHSLGHTVVGCEGVEQVHLTLLKESISLLFLYVVQFSIERIKKAVFSFKCYQSVLQACTEFFSENNIEYSRSPIEGVDGTLFTVSLMKVSALATC